MTTPLTGRLNGWTKALALFLPLAIAGLIAWGSLKSDVRHIEAANVTHATKETVAVQYDAILRELRTMNARLERLENGR